MSERDRKARSRGQRGLLTSSDPNEVLRVAPLEPLSPAETDAEVSDAIAANGGSGMTSANGSGVIAANGSGLISANGVTPPRPRMTERLDARRAHRPFLRNLLIFVAVLIATVTIVHAFLVEPVTVPGNSMSPTLQAGDRVLAWKSGLLQGSIQRGDIVVFRAPHRLRCTTPGTGNGDLILRVIAVPGETISSRAGTVLINGRPLAERGWYDRQYGQIGATPVAKTKLGANQFYVMGDDRLDGCDSRAFGPIARSSIVAKTFAVVARAGHLSVGGV